MKEYPSEGDLVLATVTKIQYHSVFCNLDEYKKSGMIHISEIAPGRIKNITDYIKEGKTTIVKVLKVDPDKGHIDLSLRRVTAAQRKSKANEFKQSKIVQNIIEQASTELKSDAEKIKAQIEKNLGSYETLFDAFTAVVEEGLSLEKQGLDKKTSATLEKLIKERIKEKSVSIKGEFSITTYASDGVEKIKSAFKKIPEGVNVSYLGAGKYSVTVDAPEYKEAEDILSSLTKNVEENLGEAEINFARTDR